MAKVLFFQNSLKEGEKPFFLQRDSQSHDYTIHRPGILYSNPDGKESKHMGRWELVKRFLVCLVLFCRSFFYDVLILDVSTMGLLIAPLLFFRRRLKVVIVHFNVLRRRRGLILFVSRLFFRRIDFFIVHSRYDIKYIAELYKIPGSKMTFWPYIRTKPANGLPSKEYLKCLQQTYIMSYGANARDYRTLFEAVERTDLQLIVVARKFNLEGLDIPKNVKVFYDIALDECDKLISNCLFSVFTFDGTEPSCGQISMVTSLMLGKPVICTDWIAVRDYIVDGCNGLLVRMGDAENLKNKMLELYSDRRLYGELSHGAKEWAMKNILPGALQVRMDRIVTELTIK